MMLVLAFLVSGLSLMIWIVLLVARVSADGGLDLLGQVEDAKLTDRALRALA